MKLILNNNSNEIILADNFEINLNMSDPSKLFALFYSTDNLMKMDSFNYIM